MSQTMMFQRFDDMEPKFIIGCGIMASENGWNLVHENKDGGEGKGG